MLMLAVAVFNLCTIPAPFEPGCIFLIGHNVRCSKFIDITLMIIVHPIHLGFVVVALVDPE